MPLILILDADPIFRSVMAKRLQAIGYRTNVAGNGADGLDLARRFPPAAVLMDLTLRGASGVDFLRALRADPALRHTPVVVAASTTDADALAAAEGLGIDDHLSKGRTSIGEISDAVETHAFVSEH